MLNNHDNDFCRNQAALYVSVGFREDFIKRWVSVTAGQFSQTVLVRWVFLTKLIWLWQWHNFWILNYDMLMWSFEEMAAAKRNIKFCLWTHVEVTHETLDLSLFFFPAIVIQSTDMIRVSWSWDLWVSSAQHSSVRQAHTGGDVVDVGWA